MKFRKLMYNTGLVPKIEALRTSGRTIEFKKTAVKLKIKMFEFSVDFDLGFIKRTILTIRNDRIIFVIEDTSAADTCNKLVYIIFDVMLSHKVFTAESVMPA
jgi:hypothetical protein